MSPDGRQSFPLQARIIAGAASGGKGRARLIQRHRSISQEVLTLVERSLTRPAGDVTVTATDAFLALAGTWDDPRSAEMIAAETRASRRKGRRCTALTHGLTLVTNTTRHFRRVPGLALANWAE